MPSTPFLWWLVLRFSQAMQTAYAESRRRSDALVLSLSESVQGLSVLRGFGREDAAIARFGERNQALREQQGHVFARCRGGGARQKVYRRLVYRA